MNQKLNHLIGLLNETLRLFLSISFGVFLFILFFQPFPLEQFDFNNRLLFVAGFGAMVFLLMFAVRASISLIAKSQYQQASPLSLPTYLESFLILALSSVAFTFYLRYVGAVNISFYIVFKIVLVCLAAPVALRLYNKYKELTAHLELLVVEKKIVQKQLEKFEEENLNKTIEFISENNNENLTLLASEVVLVKSADNYVEIVYMENNSFKKRLIRNTLRNTEIQIKQYSNFIRCHRTCIVNLHFIEKLNRSYDNNWLTIKGFQDHIPVSRQYLLKLKESL